jgi:hypothetical protein
MTDSVQKAKLSSETGKSLDCWFNPSTLKFSRAAKWQSRRASAQGVPPLSYVGGEEEKLQLDLLLHAGYGQSGDDVKRAIDWLYDLLNPTIDIAGPPLGRKRPPRVTFSWGRFVSFAAVCQSVGVSEELFDVNGGPLRASVTVQLRQALPEPGQATPEGQNPTTRAVLANRSHTVQYGDSLASIAHKHYGDPTRWREIARDNKIDDPLRLTPGRALVIKLVAP